MVYPKLLDQRAAALEGPEYDNLGVTLSPDGGTLRVWSANATAMTLVIFDDTDLDWIVEEVPLTVDEYRVWSVTTPHLGHGARYGVRADGPNDASLTYNAQNVLVDPYARGLVEAGYDSWRCAVVDNSFDWGGVQKPRVHAEDTVIYEGHVKGMTKRHPLIPPALHGTYAGLAHPAMIEHLLSLGVTSVELLPIHAFVTEPRLLQLGLTNYWGYNTVNYFSPHAGYATEANRIAGPDAVLREVKGMVKLLHAAGIEVILDVVYNHTSEEGLGGHHTSFRGIDNRSYYRQQDDGTYVDVTGCGNSVNTSTDAAARLVLDSLRYWANEVQIDGFRFDLAATLGRDQEHVFTPDHPLLRAIATDPDLAGVKMIAEPWDVGLGGWQTGNFGEGWHEWNDRYRDRVRNFWLSDIDYARHTEVAPDGIGGFATRLAGSSNTFSAERGPLASVNFVTAHDGFTLHDLVAYESKHNLDNGENNRDGADTNRSFNHGVEGPTDDETILATRRKAMRNLFGTLLLSAGIPMITAGDEFGRTQGGNNNGYCQDSPLTWVPWDHDDWQHELCQHVRHLTRLRKENPALRPRWFSVDGKRTPYASVMQWYDQNGQTMSAQRWRDPAHRTLQYLATSTPESGPANRVLLMVHGSESPIQVHFPTVDACTRFVSLWSSSDESPDVPEQSFAAGDSLTLPPTSMRLFRAE